MMFYDLGIFLMWLGMGIASPFNAKARLWFRGRRGLMKRIGHDMRGAGGERVWFHCASLGEFEQGRQLIEEWKRERPDDTVVLTFFSPSGYEVRKNYAGADFVYYLPIDTSRNAARFVRAVRPKAALFIKYEFWNNYTKALQRSGTPIYLVSAIFYPQYLFFKRYGGGYRRILKRFTHLFLQNEASRKLLETIGVTNTTVCGDTRFDRVYEIARHVRGFDTFEAFAREHKVFVAGSTWPPDDEIVLALMEKFPRVKFIVVPHEIPESKIASLVARCEALGRTTLRYSRTDDVQAYADASVVVVDTVGILSSVYQYGDFACIGGGFGDGIHNVLEAATFGLPVIFGPRYERFAEAVRLVEIGAAVPVRTAEEAEKWLGGMLADPVRYANTAEKSRDFVVGHIGATECILRSIGVKK